MQILSSFWHLFSWTANMFGAEEKLFYKKKNESDYPCRSKQNEKALVADRDLEMSF